MKKFMKVSAIIGGSLLLVGLIIIGIGAIGGGVRGIQNSYSNLYDCLEEFAHLDGKLKINGKEVFSVGDIYDLFDEDKMIYREGTYTKEFEMDEMKNLSVDIGMGEAYVKSHKESTVVLEVGTECQMQCYLENGTLYIKGSRKRENEDNDQMIIYLPENILFEDVDIEVGAGKLEIDNMAAQSLEIEVGMGSLNLMSMQTKYLSAEVGMGSADITGKILKNADLEVGMGEMLVTLSGNSQDFDYELDCGLGNLSVEDAYRIVGIGEKVIDNKAEKSICFEVAMGNGEIHFEKE